MYEFLRSVRKQLAEGKNFTPAATDDWHIKETAKTYCIFFTTPGLNALDAHITIPKDHKVPMHKTISVYDPQANRRVNRKIVFYIYHLNNGDVIVSKARLAEKTFVHPERYLEWNGESEPYQIALRVFNSCHHELLAAVTSFVSKVNPKNSQQVTVDVKSSSLNDIELKTQPLLPKGKTSQIRRHQNKSKKASKSPINFARILDEIRHEQNKLPKETFDSKKIQDKKYLKEFEKDKKSLCDKMKAFYADTISKSNDYINPQTGTLKLVSYPDDKNGPLINKVVFIRNQINTFKSLTNTILQFKHFDDYSLMQVARLGRLDLRWVFLIANLLLYHNNKLSYFWMNFEFKNPLCDNDIKFDELFHQYSHVLDNLRAVMQIFETNMCALQQNGANLYGSSNFVHSMSFIFSINQLDIMTSLHAGEIDFVAAVTQCTRLLQSYQLIKVSLEILSKKSFVFISDLASTVHLLHSIMSISIPEASELNFLLTNNSTYKKVFADFIEQALQIKAVYEKFKKHIPAIEFTHTDALKMQKKLTEILEFTEGYQHIVMPKTKAKQKKKCQKFRK